MGLLSKLLCGTCALALASCGDDDSSATVPAGFHSVVQAGSQDIGEYRSIIAAGDVPALSVLDETGFFAEHQIDLPAADCGSSICVHPMIAVAPRFDGGNWTMAFIGMNTAVDPSTLSTKPRHVVLVLGRNTFLYSYAMRPFRSALTPEDRVSVISDPGLVTPEQGLARGPSLSNLAIPQSSTPISLYAALIDALTEVKRSGFEGYASRVLLFPADFAESGLEPRAFADLALEFARHDAPISVFATAKASSTGTTSTQKPQPDRSGTEAA